MGFFPTSAAGGARFTDKDRRVIKSRYAEQWEGHQGEVKPFPAPDGGRQRQDGRRRGRTVL